LEMAEGGSWFEPKILGFLCNWCSYAAADLAGMSRMEYPPNIRCIRVMCSGRVEPSFVLEALREGYDGVLIAGCHPPSDCHYQSGNLKARRRYYLLRKLLRELGINPDRVRLEWASASEGQRFAEIVRDFTEQLRRLGPNPIRAMRVGGGE